MILLIPAFEPDDRLPALVAELTDFDGLRVLVVDDGSGLEYAAVFEGAAAAGARVVTHIENRGKGAALRSGFAFVRAHHPGEAVVCADSDGQHTPFDILKVAAALEDDATDLVLGVRQFTGPVPLRSRVGNRFTAWLFCAVTGVGVSDTQTGLRGLPHRLLEWAEQVPGERFEYELNQLLGASRERLRISEVKIATVYLAGNASSHFRPLADSAHVLRPLLAFSGSSLAGFGLDAAVLFALYPLLGNLALSVVLARLLTASVNFLVNRHLVFGAARTPLWPAARRYALVAASVLAANLTLMELLTTLIGLTLAKVLVEAMLFLIGYAAQSRFVFLQPAGSGSLAVRRRSVQPSGNTDTVSVARTKPG